MSQQRAIKILRDIERTEKALLKITAEHIAPGRPIYSSHLFLLGIGRRTLAQSRAIRQLAQDKNHLVVAALIRLQLDTAFRLHAIFWVADPEAFSRDVFAGGQINRMKAVDGQSMTDKYLKDRVLADHPWMTEVYDNTSGAVHFSSRHISAAFSVNDPSPGTSTSLSTTPWPEPWSVLESPLLSRVSPTEFGEITNGNLAV